MRIAVVTIRHASGEAGGAERFYDALVKSFRDLGHRADEVSVGGDESSIEQIKRNYLDCYDLDLSKYDMVVSTKAPSWLVRHPRHVCYLVHTIRVFYDMFEETFPRPDKTLVAHRDLIRQLDSGALSAPRCRALFSIGNEVSKRLQTYNGLDAEVLHPPLWSNDFHAAPPGDYFLLPGRLHPWKRVDLVVRAMRQVKSNVKLKIVGVGEAEAQLRELAGDDSRIEFLGRVDDEALRNLYANALAVPFTPKREDYGYITLEAFASGKPVVTCRDSGEASVLVRDGVNGFVCDAKPEALAMAMDRLAGDPETARRLGTAGQEWVNSLSWKKIAERLIAAAMEQTEVR